MCPARLDGLKTCDVCRLKALGTLGDLEFHSLSVVERPVPISLNRGEVDEHVLTGLPLDESETLTRVEPLHCSLFFHSNSYSLVLSYLVPRAASRAQKKRAASVNLQPLK